MLRTVKKKEYRIMKQLPDQWIEENRQLQAQVAKAKKANEAKDETQGKDNIQVINRTLYINKTPQKKVFLEAPTAGDIFVDKHEQDKMDNFN